MSEQPVWLLTGPEEALLLDSAGGYDRAVLVTRGIRLGAKAQAKKLVEWGMERCDDVEHSFRVASFMGLQPLRFECAECQQQLRRDVGL